MAPAPFAGSLYTKLKQEILQIAQSLGIPDVDDLNKSDLIITVQKYLEENEATLTKDDRFKGLFIKRKRIANGRPSEDSEIDVTSTTRKLANSATDSGKHLVNKGLQRAKDAGVDPSDVPLPDSVRSLRSVANNALDVVEPVADAISNRVSSAAHQGLVAWQRNGKRELSLYLRHSQETLSNAETLVQVMIFLEALILLITIIPRTEYEFQFPPSQFSTHTTARFFHHVFAWFPELKVKFRLPASMFAVLPGSEVFKDLLIWITTTLLPPYVLSHLITFLPQKRYGGGRHTRHSSEPVPLPIMDPLVFTLVRLAILLVPLTSAAPDLWRFSLEKMGSVSGRALAAGVTAGLVLADRLQPA